MLKINLSYSLYIIRECYVQCLIMVTPIVKKPYNKLYILVPDNEKEIKEVDVIKRTYFFRLKLLLYVNKNNCFDQYSKKCIYMYMYWV